MRRGVTRKARTWAGSLALTGLLRWGLAARAAISSGTRVARAPGLPPLPCEHVAKIDRRRLWTVERRAIFAKRTVEPRVVRSPRTLKPPDGAERTTVKRWLNGGKPCAAPAGAAQPQPRTWSVRTW